MNQLKSKVVSWVGLDQPIFFQTSFCVVSLLWLSALYQLALPQASWQQRHLNWPSLSCSAGSLFPELSLSHRHKLWRYTQTEEAVFERFTQLSWVISKLSSLLLKYSRLHILLLFFIYPALSYCQAKLIYAAFMNGMRYIIVFFGVQLNVHGGTGHWGCTDDGYSHWTKDV